MVNGAFYLMMCFIFLSYDALYLNLFKAYFIQSLFHSKLISFKAYFIQSLFYSKLILFKAYFIQSLFYSKLILFKAYFIQSLFYSKLYPTPHSNRFQPLLSISFKFSKTLSKL
ncbi:hypothetical protein AC786_02650 [Helicobacter pylori]|nr:hypothetical protein AC786_02650 [Helicobacter pylori]